jgi:hypothetical protein
VKTPPASFWSRLLCGGLAGWVCLAVPVQAGLRDQIQAKEDYYTTVKDKKWTKSLYEGKEFSTDAADKNFTPKNRAGESKKILPMAKNDAFGKIFDNSKRASGFEKPFTDSTKKFAGFENRSAMDGRKSGWSMEEARLGGEDQGISLARESDQRVVMDKMYRDDRKLYDGPEIKKVRQDVDIISQAAKNNVDLKDGKLTIDQIRLILNKN